MKGKVTLLYLSLQFLVLVFYFAKLESSCYILNILTVLEVLGSILCIQKVNGQITPAKMPRHHHINMQRFLFYSVKILRSLVLHVCFTVLDILYDRKITLMLRVTVKGFYPGFCQAFWQCHLYAGHSFISVWMLSLA